MGAWVDIFIRDYTEDPIDEGAFAINIEVQWPSPEVSYVRLSFAERFIEKLFRVSWHKDLSVEDKRLTKDRREVFIQWGLIRLERWIEKHEDTSKVMITYESDRFWAEQVLAKKIKPQSERVDEKHYRYWLRTAAGSEGAQAS